MIFISYTLLLRTVLQLVSVSQTPTPYHRLYQQRRISFSYSLYYTLDTDAVTSILEGRGRNIFRGMHALSLTAFRHMRDRYSEESECGKPVDSLKFLQLSADFASFWSYIQNLHSGNPRVSNLAGHPVEVAND